ncbi:MAG: hypothetical protein KJZ84_09540 [Bryobacteraceae bacterium]|nr:hypothetical protein [Bryobacteraceae bacterium]
MPTAAGLDSFLGRAPESLNIAELNSLHGAWAAVELYSPATTPLRRIQALAPHQAACLEQLAARGLDPRQYEVLMLRRPC